MIIFLLSASTDYSSAVLENCKKNVDLNSHLKETSEGLREGGSGRDDGTATVRCLDWTDRYLDLENVFTSSDRVSEMEEEDEDDIHLPGKYRKGSSFNWRRSDMPKLKEVSVILAADGMSKITDLRVTDTNPSFLSHSNL
jgi:hypothetical protein